MIESKTKDKTVEILSKSLNIVIGICAFTEILKDKFKDRFNEQKTSYVASGLPSILNPHLGGLMEYLETLEKAKEHKTKITIDETISLLFNSKLHLSGVASFTAVLMHLFENINDNYYGINYLFEPHIDTLLNYSCEIEKLLKKYDTNKKMIGCINEN